MPHARLEQKNDFQLVQGIDRPCGEMPRALFHPLKKKKSLREGRRVLNGLSGARVWN
jgi:hypothetical protein